MVNRVVGYQKVVIRFVGWRIMANRGGSTQKVANWFGSAQKLVNRGWGADFVLSGYYSKIKCVLQPVLAYYTY